MDYLSADLLRFARGPQGPLVQCLRPCRVERHHARRPLPTATRRSHPHFQPRHPQRHLGLGSHYHKVRSRQIPPEIFLLFPHVPLGGAEEIPGRFPRLRRWHYVLLGRHFVTTTIITIVAMRVLRYDVVPTSEKGINHTQKLNHLVAAVLPPDQDVKVEIVPRKTKEVWNFTVGDESDVSFSAAEEC